MFQATGTTIVIFQGLQLFSVCRLQYAPGDSCQIFFRYGIAPSFITFLYLQVSGIRIRSCNLQDGIDIFPFPFEANIRLLPEKRGLRSSGRMDTQKNDPNTIFLSKLHAHPHIFIAGKQQSICHRSSSGQLDEIRYDQGIHTLLLPTAVQQSQTKLDPIYIGQLQMFALKWTGIRWSIIPVDAKQPVRIRMFTSDVNQSCHHLGELEVKKRPGLLAACQQGRSLCKKIARINKNCETIHIRPRKV